MKRSQREYRRMEQDRFWRMALADPNCVTDGSELRRQRFARCACGAIEGILFREKADGFRCCACRAIAVQRVLIDRQPNGAVPIAGLVRQGVMNVDRRSLAAPDREARP